MRTRKVYSIHLTLRGEPKTCKKAMTPLSKLHAPLACCPGLYLKTSSPQPFMVPFTLSHKSPIIILSILSPKIRVAVLFPVSGMMCSVLKKPFHPNILSYCSLMNVQSIADCFALVTHSKDLAAPPVKNKKKAVTVRVTTIRRRWFPEAPRC